MFKIKHSAVFHIVDRFTLSVHTMHFSETHFLASKFNTIIVPDRNSSILMVRKELLAKTVERVPVKKYQSSFVTFDIRCGKKRSIFIVNCPHAFSLPRMDVLTHVHTVNVYAQVNPEPRILAHAKVLYETGKNFMAARTIASR